MDVMNKTKDDALRDIFLDGDGLNEKKELFDKDIKVWKEFFSKPELFGKINRKRNGILNCYRWNSNSKKIERLEHPRYLCSYADSDEKFDYSFYDDKNFYFEFTKEKVNLSFIVTLCEKGLRLLLTHGSSTSTVLEVSKSDISDPSSPYCKAEETNVYCSHSSTADIPDSVSTKCMFEKLELVDVYEKILAFSEHFLSEKSMTK